ncbi:MAG: hypothetical protein QTN59_08635 [Candidatus Electrothrix communis]|nr:MAG: hypothetical protein QTN59_08635 [Candidatus Electrothrix communis]
MRDSIKKAIGSTVQGFVDSGAKTSFTQKELNALDVKIPKINLISIQPKEIKEKFKIS